MANFPKRSLSKCSAIIAHVILAMFVIIKIVIKTTCGLFSKALNRFEYPFIECAISLSLKRRIAVILVSINAKRAHTDKAPIKSTISRESGSDSKFIIYNPII